MNSDKPKTVAEQALSRFLKERKMRSTPERFAILSRIMEKPHLFNAEEVYRQMDSEGYHVSLPTVYSTLSLFVEAGLIRMHTIGSGPAMYERATETANHQYLICRVCGKLKEVKDAELTSFMQERRFTAFTTEYITLTIHGICSKCQRQMKKKSRENGREKKSNSKQTKLKS